MLQKKDRLNSTNNNFDECFCNLLKSRKTFVWNVFSAAMVEYCKITIFFC